MLISEAQTAKGFLSRKAYLLKLVENGSDLELLVSPFPLREGFFHLAHLHLRSGAICRFAKQIANRVFLAGVGRHCPQLSNP